MKDILLCAFIAYLIRGIAVARMHCEFTEWEFINRYMNWFGICLLVISDCIVWPLTQKENNYNSKEENMIIFERKVKESRLREQ